MEILDIRKTDKEIIIAQACQVLAAGGLLVYPTETTYGIGVDATNQSAVNSLLAYKARREGKPLSIAVCDQQMAGEYVTINDQANNLYKNFLPGPITVISQSKNKVAAGVQSEQGTLGIRIPDYPLIRDIVRAYGKPITATSANASYKKRPYNVSDILNNISGKQKNLISLILDAGQLPPNEPSTIVDTTLDQPTVLRQGDIKLTDATRVVTHTPEETQELGKKLTSQYKHYLGEKALVFALVGELGAGKTQFSKGVAKALGITAPVTSPTFTISREYEFRHGDKINQFIHIDTWRLFSNQEFGELGFTKMIDNLAIISIEWADKIIETLNQTQEAKIIWIKLEYGSTEDERVITYSDSKID